MDLSIRAVFHGIEYIISLNVKDSCLRIDAEEESIGGGWWTAEFSSKYIEEISQKTGNYKNFTTFVKMLVTALEGSSESVYVDLLTYSDLQLLRNRKNAGGSVSKPASATKEASNKSPEPDVSILKKTINRLRSSLSILQTRDGREEDERDEDELYALREENDKQKKKISKLLKDFEEFKASSQDDNATMKLRKRITSLEASLDLEKRERKEDEIKWRKKVSDLKEEESRLKKKLNELKDDYRKVSQRSRTPQPTKSRTETWSSSRGKDKDTPRRGEKTINSVPRAKSSSSLYSPKANSVKRTPLNSISRDKGNKRGGDKSGYSSDDSMMSENKKRGTYQSPYSQSNLKKTDSPRWAGNSRDRGSSSSSSLVRPPLTTRQKTIKTTIIKEGGSDHKEKETKKLLTLKGDKGDLEDLDKRLSALQHFLDKAKKDSGV